VKFQALLAGVTALALAGSAGAGDVKSVPRSIAKQPTYAGRPGYALLVFGPEANRRVWLVLDGTTLYVDKNGNGDLTEPGEKVSAAGAPSIEENEEIKVTATEFEVGDLPATTGGSAYQGLTVSRSLVEPKPGAPADMKGGDNVYVSVAFRDICDQSAAPSFSAKPEDAPVVHFDGPLIAMVAAGCEGPTSVLFHGDDEQELTIQIGTQGLGAGSWAPMGYGPVPDTVKPLLEIAFPAATPGGAPVVAKFTLDDRC
jgi:hypothetical protein